MDLHGDWSVDKVSGTHCSNRFYMESDYIRTKNHLQILTYFSKSIFRKNTVNDIFWDIITNCIEKLGFVDCVIYIIDKERQVLVQKAAYGDKNINFEDVLNPIEIPIGDGIVGNVAKTGKPELIPDTRNDPRYIIDDENRLSELSVPIFSQNEVIGVIDSEHPQAGFYEQYHLNVMQDIASISGFKISTTLSVAERDDLVSLLMENPNPVFRVSSNLNVILYSKSARNIVRQLKQMPESERYNILYHSVEKALLENKTIKSFLQLDEKAYSVDIIPFFEQNYANLYLEDVTAYFQAKEQAEKANLTKADFISVMSHEIRTPLNSILNLNRLLSATEKDPERSKLFEAIEFSGENLLTIVNDILDFEKLDAGKVVFQKSRFIIRDLFDRFYHLVHHRAKDKSIELLFNVNDNVGEAFVGDENRLLQILTNLVVNALKFTEKGYIRVSIDCIEEQDQLATLKFTVKDTGIGIAKDKLKTIFRRYEQAHSWTKGNMEGTGLGLTITQRLVEQQSGMISVDSEMGVGTTFSVVLPFEVSHASSTKPEQVIKADDIDLQGKKILVVDDAPINIFVAKKFLDGWFVDVLTAENGQQAVEICETEAVDLILMDLQMPVLDGYQASSRIRSGKGINADVPIIAMSADVLSSSRELLEKNGINDQLEKPFHPNELKLKIHNNIYN